MSERDEVKAKAVEDIQKGIAFIMPFARAVIRLRNCEKDEEARGVYLTREEAKAVVEGLRLLREGARK